MFAETMGCFSTRPIEVANGYRVFDIRSDEERIIREGEIVKIKTGLKVALREGEVMRLWERSGRASQGWEVLGGVIDFDYRGEIMVITTWRARKGMLEFALGAIILALGLAWFDWLPGLVIYLFIAYWTYWLFNYRRIERGDKICQAALILPQVANFEHVREEELKNDTKRGDKGFGSSGR